jgi:glycosyltransferase involved in cell wall biosynthesis
MRILIFHGYLLRGTGSNVYNAELARALAAAGHDVHLLCQERNPESLEFVDAVGDWNTGALEVSQLGRDRPAGTGSCTVYRPPIADLLPVYVADNYEGFTAKTFDLLTDEELDFYNRRNVMAVQEVSELASPDCALANHMVMGPFVLARGLPEGVPYAVKIHGSAMEYTVRPHPRFLPFAEEGVSKASTVLVGSRHIAERTWDTLRIKDLSSRIFLGPPGVDVERFKPKPAAEAIAALADLADTVYGLPRNGYGPAAASATANLYDRVRTASRTEGTTSYEEIATLISDMHLGYDTAGIDPVAPDALKAISADTESPIVLYVGKLIVSKGVDLLLTAWPIVRQKYPNARLAITGFGAYREGLELFLSALSDGDLTSARWIAAGGRAFEGGPKDSLNYVGAFLDGLEGEQLDEYLSGARGMRDSVYWFGRLEHDVLADLTPAARCQVVPSTFPEAFGMVAAEAAACGVTPISAHHSGLAEVTDQLQVGLSGVASSLLNFDLGPRAVQQLSGRIHGLLGMGYHEYNELSARLADTAREQFSWAGVARDLAAAASGDHSSLRHP